MVIRQFLVKELSNAIIILAIIFYKSILPAVSIDLDDVELKFVLKGVTSFSVALDVFKNHLIVKYARSSGKFGEQA